MRGSLFVAGSIGLLILAAACQQDRPTEVSSDSKHPMGGETVQEQGGRFLPVGTIVPVGQPIEFPPEPFDPRRHHAVPSNLEAFNLVGRPGFEIPQRHPRPSIGDPGASSPMNILDPSPGTADISVQLHTTSQLWTGVFQVADAGLDVVLPSRSQAQGPAWIFAPTVLPPNHTCIEATTMHRRFPNQTTEHLQTWFDWCESGDSGAYVLAVDLTNSVIANRYIRTYLGKPTLTISLSTSGGSCWYSWIYNYEIGNYEINLIKCPAQGTNGHSPGTNDGLDGWTAWESYYLLGTGQCPVLANIRDMDVRLKHPQTGSFVALTDYPTDYSFGHNNNVCWTNFGGPGPYSFTFPAGALGLPANSWFAQTTPPPLSISLSGPSSVRSGATCLWTATPTTGVAPYTYSWNLGPNGSSVPGELIYQNSGSAFTVTVTVYDAVGATGNQSKSVSISPSAPVCSY